MPICASRLFLLTSCSHASVVPSLPRATVQGSQVPDPNGTGPVIDSDLSAGKKAVLAKVIAGLGPSLHGDLVYVDKAGLIYSNKQSIADAVALHEIVNNTYVDGSGNRIPVPAFQPEPSRVKAPFDVNPSPTTSSGPYRRIYTYSPFNNTFAVMDFTVPCDAVPYPLQGPAGDTGYIYSGGWDYTGNEYLDAGVQYSAARGQMNLYYRLNKNKAVILQNNFSCGPIEHEIQVAVAGGYLAETVSDVVTDVVTGKLTRINSVTAAQQPSFDSNWTSGATLKAMVSLAQDPDLIAVYGYQGVIQDGYFFGAPGGYPSIPLRARFGACQTNNLPIGGVETICATAPQSFSAWQLQQVPDSDQVRSWNGYGDGYSRIEKDGIALYDDAYPYGTLPYSTPVPEPTDMPTPQCRKCPPPPL